MSLGVDATIFLAKSGAIGLGCCGSLACVAEAPPAEEAFMRAQPYRSSALGTEHAGATALLDVPAFVPSLGYLRALVVMLVVVFHSLFAYLQHAPPVSPDFAGGERLWRAFLIIDAQRWVLGWPIVIINDTFFMSLMFLLSGLFVSQSVLRLLPRGPEAGGACLIRRANAGRSMFRTLPAAGFVPL
jgi:hypothetical protein